MMNYFVLDTSAIIHVLRDTPNGRVLNDFLENYNFDFSLLVSAVTVGELASLKFQQNWKGDKCKQLDNFLENITVIDVLNSDIELISNYAKLDAFSLRKIPGPNGSLKVGSAIGMGKNDLWIASTALTMDATLITSDADFKHLADIYIKVFII